MSSVAIAKSINQVPQFCSQFIQKAEINNLCLGRINDLEFKESLAKLYFAKEFDFNNFMSLTDQVLAWQLTPKDISKLSNPQVLTSFYLLEKVLWYYNDHLLNFRYKIKNLYVLLSLLFPSLQDRDLKYLTNRYNNLVQELPISGAILISEKPYHVLLVKNNFGRTWSYPKGKLFPGEQPSEAAIRECWEETGYNIRTRINPKNMIIKKYHKKMVYLYVIQNVPRDFIFKPENNKEIVDIKWVPIDQTLYQSRDFNIYINRSYHDLLRYTDSANDPEQKGRFERPIEATLTHHNHNHNHKYLVAT
jgi:8-oxo-dGTP pyrophosphatase MutT (NUDIX family)